MRRFLAGAVVALGLILIAVALIGPPRLVSAGSETATATTAAGTQDPGQLTPDTLRNLIYDGDVAAVAAGLANLPTTTLDAKNAQRALFAVFGELHPKVIAFAKDWAEAEPQNPAALAARGWSLHAMGWAFRGSGYVQTIHPQAREAFVAAHAEGLRLMQAASALDPRFLPASDGILAMSYTIGQPELIAPEVDRIMGLLPNRWTMTLAGQGLAPNWGGSLKQMEMLCKAQAPKVADRPNYDATVCLVDGVMRSGSMTMDELKSIYAAITKSDNPLILEWLNQDGNVEGDTPAARLAYLDRIKTTRPLTYLEANIYDQNAESLSTLTGEKRPPEFPDAVRRMVENARLVADRNPGDWNAVRRLINATIEDRDLNGTPPETADHNNRARASLMVNPFSAGAWSQLGMQHLLSSDGGEMSGILRAEPYFINAAVYSGYEPEHLRMLGGVKLSLFFRNRANGTTPGDPALWQSGVVCPMVQQLRLLLATCAARGGDVAECSQLPFAEEDLERQFAEITEAGLCMTEARAPVEDLLYQPQQVDLQVD